MSSGTDLLIPTSDYVTSVNAIAAAAPTDIADQVNYWVQALVVIDQSVGDYIQNAPIDTADILSSVSSSISFLAQLDDVVRRARQALGVLSQGGRIGGDVPLSGDPTTVKDVESEA